MKETKRAMTETKEQAKVCTQCDIKQPFVNFHNKKNSRDGLRSECKSCCLVNSNKWKNNNPEKRKTSYDKWRQANIDRERRNKRAYAQANKEAARNRELKNEYGITLADYHRMSQSQNGECAICKRSDVKLCVDHCHTTGAVRGLLCSSCNKGLGHFGDNINLLSEASNYLKTSQIAKAI